RLLQTELITAIRYGQGFRSSLFSLRRFSTNLVLPTDEGTAIRISAEIPFDNILDRFTGSDPSVTDYHSGTAGKVPELPSQYSGRHSDRTFMNVYLNPYFHWCASCWKGVLHIRLIVTESIWNPCISLVDCDKSFERIRLRPRRVSERHISQM